MNHNNNNYKAHWISISNERLAHTSFMILNVTWLSFHAIAIITHERDNSFLYTYAYNGNVSDDKLVVWQLLLYLLFQFVIYTMIHNGIKAHALSIIEAPSVQDLPNYLKSVETGVLVSVNQMSGTC